MKLFRCIFVLLFLILIFGVENSLACMCGNISICESYSNVDAVVVAKVKGYKPAKIPKDAIFANGDPDEYKSGQSVSLEVSKIYKGQNLKKITLLQPNSSCDWIFSEKHQSKKYLFYLIYSKKYNRYRITMCGRSSPIEHAADDLSWLDSLPYSLKRTRLSGSVRINKEDNSIFPTVPNIQIQINGKEKNYSVNSNKFGMYEVWDLPIGRYRILPNLADSYQLAWTNSTPENWTYFWNPDRDLKALDVTINKDSCGGIDFMIEKKRK